MGVKLGLLTLNEEYSHKLRVFGSDRKEVTGSWRKFNNSEVLHDLYSSPNICRLI
jgi:hypothetical protein